MPQTWVSFFWDSASWLPSPPLHPAGPRSPTWLETATLGPPIFLMGTWILYLKDEAITLGCPFGHPFLPPHAQLPAPFTIATKPLCHHQMNLLNLKYYFNWSSTLVQKTLSKIPRRTLKTLHRPIFHLWSSPTWSSFRHVLVRLLSPHCLGDFPPLYPSRSFPPILRNQFCQEGFPSQSSFHWVCYPEDHVTSLDLHPELSLLQRLYYLCFSLCLY